MFSTKIEKIIVAAAVVEIEKQGLSYMTNAEQGYIISDCLKACDRLQHISGAAVQRLIVAVVDDFK